MNPVSKTGSHDMNGAEARVAVLVDCDNVTPEILSYALRVVLLDRRCSYLPKDIATPSI